MSEIPADVIAAGNRFADLFGDGRQGYAAFDIAVLAVMEERERCAKVADDLAGSSLRFMTEHIGVHSLDFQRFSEGCENVARAIRRGPEGDAA